MTSKISKFSEIKNLTDLLEKCVKRKVLSYSLKYLTKPGDNYGSIMQSIEAEVVNKDGMNNQSEILHLVSKTAVTNEYLIQIFQPDITFVKENRFYSDIIPALERFEVESNVPESERIDAFIRCFGSRLSLNPDADSGDADAALILENTKLLGFINEDRHIGFDLATTYAILKTLAQFHALFVAMRILQPHLFNTAVRPYLVPINLNGESTELCDSVCRDIGNIENMDPGLRTKILSQLKCCDKFGKITTCAPDTPYTTIAHRDLWVNNIMVLKNANGNTTRIKIYDFQLYFYNSFVHDLVFFLFTSVRLNDLMEHFNVFIRFYYEQFIGLLVLLQCPLNDYSFNQIWTEIQDKAKLELLHALFMVKICLADGNATPDLADLKPDTFVNDCPPSADVLKRWQCIIQLFEANGFI